MPTVGKLDADTRNSTKLAYAIPSLMVQGVHSGARRWATDGAAQTPTAVVAKPALCSSTGRPDLLSDRLARSQFDHPQCYKLAEHAAIKPRFHRLVAVPDPSASPLYLSASSAEQAPSGKRWPSSCCVLFTKLGASLGRWVCSPHTSIKDTTAQPTALHMAHQQSAVLKHGGRSYGCPEHQAVPHQKQPRMGGAPCDSRNTALNRGARAIQRAVPPHVPAGWLDHPAAPGGHGREH